MLLAAVVAVVTHLAVAQDSSTPPSSTQPSAAAASGSAAPRVPPLPPLGSTLPRRDPARAPAPASTPASTPASASLPTVEGTLRRVPAPDIGAPLANPIVRATPAAVTKIDPNALAWDAREKSQNVQVGENEARFVFAFTNVTASDVTLERVQTSCGCTAARLPMQPWVVPPGGRGDISVVMDVRGKYGTVTKTATVFSSAGPFQLMVKSILPAQTANERPMGDRSRNLQIAAADRQAALRGDCATCHVAPAVGKVGKELFETACGICHTAEHRASFVPELPRPMKPTDLGYWTTWITLGREGTLMPAFHKSRGGFLDDEQIQSLATYLETEFKLEAALLPGAAKPAPQPAAPLAPLPQAK